MVSLRHLNIVAYYGRCLAPPCIITEYCSRGSLACVLGEARRDPATAAALTWRRRLSLVRARVHRLVAVWWLVCRRSTRLADPGAVARQRLQGAIAPGPAIQALRRHGSHG